MAKIDDLSGDHISWLVKSRSENQAVTLKLFLVMKDNEEKLKGDFNLADFAQSLVGVCFSLWRAVFLSDLADDSSIEGTVSDAQAFLGNLILHNMVAYPQDRNTREWTFNYYVNNARYRLKHLSGKNPAILSDAFVEAGKGFHSSKDFWSFNHNACEVAVRNLEIALRKISN